jgi:hypothetical protein
VEQWACNPSDGRTHTPTHRPHLEDFMEDFMEDSKMVAMLKKHNLTFSRGRPFYYAECDEGWIDIIERLIIDLKAMGWKGEVHQIKEKFGGLRFYCSGNGVDSGRTQEFWDRIAQAEEESIHTCEVCGKPGFSRSGGWIKTLCDEHANGRKGWDFGERAKETE